MQQSDRRLDIPPRPARSQNEMLFTVFLVFVLVGLMFGVFIPKSVKADALDRLRWEAPPARVADVLMQKAVDARIADSRCLEARSEVLATVGVDAKSLIDRKRSLVVSPGGGLHANLRIPD